jgi:hypothetical protein
MLRNDFIRLSDSTIAIPLLQDIIDELALKIISSTIDTAKMCFRYAMITIFLPVQLIKRLENCNKRVWYPLKKLKLMAADEKLPSIEVL